MNTQQEAMDLEKSVIPPDRWDTEVPATVVKMARKCRGEGIPTGIAYSERRGWCIIESGQGPYIAWAEHSPESIFSRVVEVLRAQLSREQFLEFAQELDGDADDRFSERVAEQAAKLDPDAYAMESTKPA